MQWPEPFGAIKWYAVPTAVVVDTSDHHRSCIAVRLPHVPRPPQGGLQGLDVSTPAIDSDEVASGSGIKPVHKLERPTSLFERAVNEGVWNAASICDGSFEEELAV